MFFKMSINSRDQPEKAPKSGKTSQIKNKTNQAKQISKAKKSSEKTRREKKKKNYQKQCKKLNNTFTSIKTRANAQALEYQRNK